MRPLLCAFALVVAGFQGGCAAVSAVGSVAALGVDTVATTGSIALSGAGAAAKAGSYLVPAAKPAIAQ